MRSFSPADYYGVPYSTEAGAEAGTDSTSAINSAISAAYSAGGGVIDLTAGIYRATQGLLLPNTSTATVNGSQPPLRFQGAGGYSDSKANRPTCGTGILWTSDSGSAVAKIDTRGMGYLTFDNVTLASAAGYGLTKPFVHSTFTCIQTGTGVAFVGGLGVDAPSLTYPLEDAFVLGGTHPHETDGTDRRSADCGFQGYGTVIDKVYFACIRRAAVVQRYANGVRILNNNLWRCGNLSSTGGGIEIIGNPGGGDDFVCGVVVQNNLIEASCFRYGVYVQKAYRYTISGNDIYDAYIYTDGGVYIASDCGVGIVDGSLAPVGKPYLVDPSGHALSRGC